MSNLLKSKFLLGIAIVAVMFVGVAVVNIPTAAAADCAITKTLKLGSKGDEVKCLQTVVGVTADGKFGKGTKAAVVAWQKSAGLTADGVFGKKSNAVLVTGGSVVTTTGCPVGQFDPMTGLPCGSVTTTTTLPPGCTSTSGYSSTVANTPCSSGTAVSQTGPVAVMLATDTPASGYIIGGQAIADLAHLAFTGNGTLNSVTLHRTGISDQNTLSNLYLYDGTTRLTDGYSFNNAGDLTMNSLNIAINGLKNLSVRADVAVVTNASSLGVTLTSFTAGSAATAVNVKSNEMTYGTGNLATVYLATQASVAVPAASVNAGTSAYTVWSAPVQVNTRAVSLKGANFRITGSAPSDALGNINLFVDGVAAGSSATLGNITGSNYAMFDFSSAPVSLSTGSHTVEVRADIVKGSSYTVTLSVQQASDLVLYDGQVGVNLAAAVSASAAFVANTAGTITINAGSASVVIDPTFNALTNITGGATNVVIAKYKIHGYGEDVKISSIDVLPVITGMTPTAAGLNNLTVYFNGSQVGSSYTVPASPTTPAVRQFTFGSQMIIPAGTDSYIEVRADLQTAGSVNYTAGSISADLNVGASNGQGQTSKSTLNFPTATITGKILSIQAGILAVSKSNALANTTVSPNTPNAKVGSFILQNQSTSESVRVTSLAVSLFNATIALTSATTPALTNFQSLYTSENVNYKIQPAATNTFSVNLTIAPGGTKTVDVFVDTGSTGSSAALVTKLVATSLGVTSNVSISQNGNATAVSGQTITLVAGSVTLPPTLVSSASTTGQFVPAATSGATNATKAEFNIAATNGSATISEMKFVVRGTATSSAVGAVSSISVGSVSAPIVTATTNSTTLAAAITDAAATTLTLTSATGVSAGTVLTIDSEDILVTDDTGGATVTTVTRGYNGTTAAIHLILAATSVKNGVAYLPGLSLVVPNGGSGLNVDAMVTYSAVGTNGIASMTLANVSLSYLKYTAGNTTSTACVASLSCTGASAEVAAPTMALVGSKPTLTVTGSTDTLGNASVKLLEVTVTADAKGDIKLVTLPISVSATGVAQLTTGTLVVKDTSCATIPTTNDTLVTTSAGASDTATITFTGDYLIPAGTPKTFRIYNTVNTVSGATNTTSLSSTIANGTTALFSWKDVAGANATAITSAQNTTYFYNYPTETSVIHN